MKTGKGTRKRENILRAAAKVFSDKGYADGTLSEIGELANTYAGSLYYYYSSKDALVEEVLNIGTKSVFTRVKTALAALPAEIPIYEKIKIALEEHLDQMLLKDDFVVAYWKLIDYVPPDLRERHLKHPRGYGAFWTKLLKEGQAAGIVKKNLDPGLLQLLLIGSTIYALDWFNPSGKLTPREIADVLIEMFFFGVVPQGEHNVSFAQDERPAEPLSTWVTRSQKTSEPVRLSSRKIAVR